MACDAAFDAHARDRFAIQRPGPMQRGMIESGYFRMQSPTIGTGGGPLNGSGTFLANGRNQRFALVARNGISGSLDMTQSACLSGLTLRARRSRRTVGSAFATLASHALWARGTLLAGASLRTGGSR